MNEEKYKAQLTMNEEKYKDNIDEQIKNFEFFELNKNIQEQWEINDNEFKANWEINDSEFKDDMNENIQTYKCWILPYIYNTGGNWKVILNLINQINKNEPKSINTDL